MIQLHRGDCLDILPTIPDASVDSVCTDPPYGLNMMNRSWDHSVPGVPYWEAMLRVVKPGGYLAAFGGTRTFHRQVCAIEDAGWEIRDTLMWLYGQGYPKGKGCLKPSWEPITLARKPGRKVLPLQVDACRIAVEAGDYEHPGNPKKVPMSSHSWNASEDGSIHCAQADPHPAGRWPANAILQHHESCERVGTKRVKGSVNNGSFSHKRGGFSGGSGGIGHDYVDPDGLETVEAWECHEDCPVRLLDEMTADLQCSGNLGGTPKNNKGYGEGWPEGRVMAPSFGDTGGASRFLYCAKADRDDRGRGNRHPTVKPKAVVDWLARLITPAGGTILDPFMGSGTCGVVCIERNFGFVGIDNDAEPGAFATAERRVAEAKDRYKLFIESEEKAGPPGRASGPRVDAETPLFSGLDDTEEA
jgi:site-specific DNA-methyltransferase (adenine-specific)